MTVKQLIKRLEQIANDRNCNPLVYSSLEHDSDSMYAVNSATFVEGDGYTSDDYIILSSD